MKLTIDVASKIATVIISLEGTIDIFTLLIKLPSISEDNYNYINTFIEKDWSSTKSGDVYYINQVSTITKAPIKPNNNYVWDWDLNTWKDQRSIEDITIEVRTKRDELLKASDWTQMPDVVLNTKTEWANYRQALRDIMSQPDITNITWPIAPN